MKRLSLTQQYWLVNRDILWKLYDGYNIQNIYFQCVMALEKLKKISYTQPLIKNLQNTMGFLQYILLRENMTDLDRRNKYSKLLKESAPGDSTHTNLRAATSYLDDGVKKDCLSITRTVTDMDDNYFMQQYRQRFRKTIQRDTEAFI